MMSILLSRLRFLMRSIALYSIGLFLNMFYHVRLQAPEPELPKPALVGMPIPSATGLFV